jgi:hypothetical protein
VHVWGDVEKAEKARFFGAARRSMGRTALCLSGGGSITCYHVGVVSVSCCTHNHTSYEHISMARRPRLLLSRANLLLARLLHPTAPLHRSAR